MAKNRLQNFRTLSIMATALSAALVLSGCDNTEEEPDDSAAGGQQLTNVGVSLSAPGLISGVNTDNVSGVEVDLAVALSEQLEVTSDAEEIAWVSTDVSQAAEQLETGALEVFIGQISQGNLVEDIAWVGPYLSVDSGLLVRSSVSQDGEGGQEFIATEAVGALEDLREASVCVVAGSLAEGAQLPADELTSQQTVTECETGMRSGRYDAIAADDVQLAGLLATRPDSDDYELLLWSDLAEDSDEEIPEQLLDSGQYWIGTTPEQCEAAATALTELVSEGTVEEIFGQWDDTIDYEPQVIEAEEITTRNCNA